MRVRMREYLHGVKYASNVFSEIVYWHDARMCNIAIWCMLGEFDDEILK